MKRLNQIEKEINALKKVANRINHLKELAKHDIIYAPRPIREHEKLFLENFDKLNIEQLVKLTKKSRSQIYQYFTKLDKCISASEIK